MTWDRLNAEYYKRILHTPPPEGETPLEIRQILSDILLHSLAFITSMPISRLIIETPLIGNRGEKGKREKGLDEIYYLPSHSLQILIMYSPKTRKEIMEKNIRRYETSAQPTAMDTIRQNLLRDCIPRIDNEEEEEYVLTHWKNFLRNRNGMVVYGDKYMHIKSLTVGTGTPQEIIDPDAFLPEKLPNGFLPEKLVDHMLITMDYFHFREYNPSYYEDRA